VAKGSDRFISGSIYFFRRVPIDRHGRSWFPIASFHLNLRKYHPGIARKVKNSFPELRNKSRQPTIRQSEPATSAEKSCHENRRKTVQSNADVQVATTFSSWVTDLYVRFQFFLAHCLTSGSFEILKQITNLVFLSPQKYVKLRDVALWYICAYYLEEARVNLDSSFRCSVVTPFVPVFLNFLFFSLFYFLS